MICIMQVVAELGINMNVIGLIPATENLPGGSAYMPGDVLTLNLGYLSSSHSISIIMGLREFRVGRFIVIEGIDQSGKKTQTELLMKRLVKTGYGSVIISFPVYRTKIGRLIRRSLMDDDKYTPRVRHMLFSANRWELNNQIEVELSKKTFLICNRYFYSNLAYGIANGLDETWLTSLDDGLPRPDLTIFIDISPSLSLTRKKDQRDVHERDQKLLSRVRRIYRGMANNEDWVMIDGRGDPDVIADRIWRCGREYFKLNDR